MYINYPRPLHYWNYFLTIEDELIETIKYVELNMENKNTFSIKYTKIILEASSEVEVLLNQISKRYGLTKKRSNWGDYFQIVNKNLKTLITDGMVLEQYGIIVKPFIDWKKEEELEWHKAYNSLKHDRGKHYKKANMENALDSVSALFTTVIHYYQCIAKIESGNMKTRISDVVNSITPNAKLIRYSDEHNNWNVVN